MTTHRLPPVTAAEAKLLKAISCVVGQALPMEWLKPAQRAMVKRMKVKGFIGKRNQDWAIMTQKGKRAR